MMRTANTLSLRRRCWLAAVAAMVISTSAAAELIDRGSGLIYDTVLNVTWLQDANYAKTSGYNATGRMTYKEAQAWASKLAIRDTVRGTTLTGWRLPRTGPVNGTSFDLMGAGLDGFGMYNGGSDVGYWMAAPGSAFAGSTSNEMANLHYWTLGNRGWCGAPGAIDSNYCLTESPNAMNMGFGAGGTAYVRNNGPFRNVGIELYWGGDLPTPRTTYGDRDAFAFNFNFGLQHAYSDKSIFMAWPVRDGDVTAVTPPPVVTPPPATSGNVTLSVKTAGGKGVVTGNTGGINCGRTCSATVVPGTVVGLTAAPEAGYRFLNWSGACAGSAPTCFTTVNANVTATANFTR